jgi:hypothetical protein
MISQISEARCSLKRQRQLRTQTNGKFNVARSADEITNNFTVEPLFTIARRQHMYWLRRCVCL